MVGSGAREHALAWRLARSPKLTELHAAPGNPGIAALGRCHPVRADDGDGLLALAVTLDADLVVIGPEGPLVAGVADELRRNGIAVFGPGAEAARIEGSKTFAKDVMRAAGVPTAETLAVARPPCVVKADGLAAGKGVFVCRTAEELDEALRAVRQYEGGVVIEELLDGREVSLFAISDGRRAVPLGAAQDFKRIGDGDTGPNTGGMGAYSPVPWFDDADELVGRIHQPIVDELARRGTPFVGCLFAGLMVTDDGPKVLEFNARFGDPETQALMPRLESDLLATLAGRGTRRPRRRGARALRRGGGHGRARRAGVSGAKRLRRCDDRGHRRGGGERRSRLPRRNRCPGRQARDERRPHPVRHRHRQNRRGGAGACVRCRRDDPLRRRTSQDRHRGCGRWLSPLVGILVGSESDRARMQAAMDELDARGIAWEFDVRSAHRAPDAVAEYAKAAAGRGLKVLICGAGLAAALPGVVAAHTELPVIGVPLRSSMSVLDGLDALLSIVQMPPGVPVATVGVDNAKNAAVLAARIIALA